MQHSSTGNPKCLMMCAQGEGQLPQIYCHMNPHEERFLWKSPRKPGVSFRSGPHSHQIYSLMAYGGAMPSVKNSQPLPDPHLRRMRVMHRRSRRPRRMERRDQMR